VEEALSTAEQNAAPTAISAETRVPALHHVTFKTKRLQEMIDWYRTMLGAEVVFQWPGGVFLTLDDANHRIAMISVPNLVDPGDRVAHVGMHHSAYEYPQLDDLLATYTRLKALGILPHVTIDHGLTTSFYYADPDGNSVELQVDNYGDWAQSKAFMQHDPRFAADQFGAIVDPEALIQARRDGLDPAQVHERSYAGAYPSSTPPDFRIPM
jgi:catechol-2,3-dioxygenase